MPWPVTCCLIASVEIGKYEKHTRNHKKFFVLGFFCVNDNVQVDFENTQIVHCIFCYQNLVIGINLRMKK